MNPTKSETLTRIALSVFKLNGQLIEWGNHFSHVHGLTSARWQMLGAIALASDPPTIPQIAAAMGVTRQGVLKQINLLVDEGLVTSQTNPAHKRSALYALTPHGASIYQSINKRWQQHVEDIAPNFSKTDLAAAMRVLSVMSQVHGPVAQD